MKSTSKMPGIAQIKEMRQDLKSTSPTNRHMNHCASVFPSPALASAMSLGANKPLLPLQPFPQVRQCLAQPPHCSQPSPSHIPHQPWDTQLLSYHSAVVLAMVLSTQVFPRDPNCPVTQCTAPALSELAPPMRGMCPIDQALLILQQRTQR